MRVLTYREMHEKLHALLLAYRRECVQSDINEIPNALIVKHYKGRILLNYSSRNEAIHTLFQAFF